MMPTVIIAITMADVRIAEAKVCVRIAKEPVKNNDGIQSWNYALSGPPNSF